ncbi:hypothetical protein BC831DRAFT_441660 [Entophlyctis helioformis]|nr:hypothetical protein BC831DRAFT_441660 [Entophlyctis helioformis]
METPQGVVLPASHYPVRIIAWRVRLGDIVVRDQPLGLYEYTTTVTVTVPVPTAGSDADADADTDGGARLPSMSPKTTTTTVKRRTREEIRTVYEGRVDAFGAEAGQEVLDPRLPLLIIVEPCGHPVQLNGLCAICGKDLSIADYTGTDTARATINMTHDSLGVTISQREALRIENETSERLKQARKLSLVLDLDQTVIHATVDPTVGEWMADPENPNFPALTEVHHFTLPDSQVIYYIKLRPGTRQFLNEMFEKYEMHIYTMGTRNYARAVAKILDPDRRLFADRILSRDDSGSFSFKSLQRLFPCDQSMVVVVDDRADVWQWSPNLLRIKPYDFFVGIGDINEPAYIVAANESHPKTKPPSILNGFPSDTTPAGIAQSSTPAKAATTALGRGDAAGAPLDAALASESIPTAAVESLAESGLLEASLFADTAQTDPDGEEDDSSEHKAEILAKMHDEQIHALEDQQKNRPLLHSQEEADAEDEEVEETAATVIPGQTLPVKDAKPSSTADAAAPEGSAVLSGTDASTPAPPNTTAAPAHRFAIPHKKRPVLVDADNELQLIKQLMERIHGTFFARLHGGESPMPSDRGRTNLGKLADVRIIVPEMKRSVLAGLHIVFSSVIPLGMDPVHHELWISATTFGATCHADIDADGVDDGHRITHVVAAKRSTAKVNAARKLKGVAVVRVEWLTDSIKSWKRADELSYLLDPEIVPLDFDFGDSRGPAPAIDEDELLIAAGKWDHADDVFGMVGRDDWKTMDDEVERAMMESDSDEDAGGDKVADRDGDKGGEEGGAAMMAETAKGTSGSSSDDDDFGNEIDDELFEILGPSQQKSSSQSKPQSQSQLQSQSKIKTHEKQPQQPTLVALKRGVVSPKRATAGRTPSPTRSRPDPPERGSIVRVIKPVMQSGAASNSPDADNIDDDNDDNDDAYFEQMGEWNAGGDASEYHETRPMLSSAVLAGRKRKQREPDAYDGEYGTEHTDYTDMDQPDDDDNDDDNDGGRGGLDGEDRMDDYDDA